MNIENLKLIGQFLFVAILMFGFFALIAHFLHKLRVRLENNYNDLVDDYINLFNGNELIAFEK